MQRMKHWWSANRSLLAVIFTLAWPAMMEHALQTIVQYADSAMVGQMGAKASAAVGLTSTVTWLVNSPMFALGIGFVACIARAMGAKDMRTVRVAAMQSVFAVLALGVGLTIVTVGLSPYIPVWMGGKEEIRGEAGRYFAIICAPMIFRASTVIFGSALRASGDTRTPMLVSAVMNGINLVLNFFLIFPARDVRFFGLSFVMPGAGLGVTGAAIATAVSYVVSGTLMFLCMMRSPFLSLRGMRLKLDRPVMRQCIRVGLPVAATRVGVCLGQVVFLAQVAGLGTVSLAAHSLALTAESAIYLPGFGMQAAASTLAGNAVGERSEHKLMRVSRLVTASAMLMMTVTGAIMFAFPAQMMRIFTPDAEVIAQGVGIMRIVAVTEPIYAAGIILEGIFNGVGDTKAPFAISIGTMWGIRILFTWLCVNVFHMGLNAVWTCMAADNVGRAILLSVRFFRGKWKRPLNLLPPEALPLDAGQGAALRARSRG